MGDSETAKKVQEKQDEIAEVMKGAEEIFGKANDEQKKEISRLKTLKEELEKAERIFKETMGTAKTFGEIDVKTRHAVEKKIMSICVDDGKVQVFMKGAGKKDIPGLNDDLVAILNEFRKSIFEIKEAE